MNSVVLIVFLTGNYVATGSADTSIKLLDVQKMKTYNQLKETAEEFGSAKPVTRTFYDHTQVLLHSSLDVLLTRYNRESMMWIFIQVLLNRIMC